MIQVDSVLWRVNMGFFEKIYGEKRGVVNNQGSGYGGGGGRKKRVINVFVSSTFADMKRERDVLATEVFPKLKTLCDKRGVCFYAIDLRWGVPGTEDLPGIVRYCLEEVERCAPYFICMLGERYGTPIGRVEGPLPRQHEWVCKDAEMSVTHAEIMHGVLRNPDMAFRTYFYFRDAGYVGSVSDEERRWYEDTDPRRKKRLEGLKREIREVAKGRVREGYKTPEELGELVYKDLKAVIEEEYPEEKEVSWFEREGLEQEAYKESRFGLFIGREGYFERLDRYVEGKEKPLLLVGESGCGKVCPACELGEGL